MIAAKGLWFLFVSVPTLLGGLPAHHKEAVGIYGEADDCKQNAMRAIKTKGLPAKAILSCEFRPKGEQV